MAEVEKSGSPRTYLFQYTAESGVDAHLSQLTSIEFSWNSRAPEIAAGDLVILQRAGRAPSGMLDPAQWAGITGWGRALSSPIDREGRRTPRTVPIELLATQQAADRRSLIPRSQYCYDHRLASTAPVFGQQGSNFLLSDEAAAAFLERLGRASLIPEHINVPVLDSRPDALTTLLTERGYAATLQTARALNAARAIVGMARSQNNQITWRRLMAGILYLGQRLRVDAKTGALARILYEITAQTDAIDIYFSQFSSDKQIIADVDWRKVANIKSLSPSSQNALFVAARLSLDRPMTIDALLAALLLDENHGDKAYLELFGVNRATLINRLISGAEGRAAPRELATFRSWFDWLQTSGVFSKPSTTTPLESLPSSGPLVAGTLNDSVKHGKDFLDVGNEARAFARLIVSSAFEPPLAIGVFGPWGSGKTFFMEQIARELDSYTTVAEAASDDTGNMLRHVVPIRFNAWHYMETNVWASLVDVIFRDLDGWLRKRTDGHRIDENSVDQLYESLSTARAERLEAIETVAERLHAREQARQHMKEVDDARRGHWWEIGKALLDGSPKDFARTMDSLGLAGLAGEGEKLRAAIRSLDAAKNDTVLLWGALRAKVANPIWLLALVLPVAATRPILDWLGTWMDGEPSISTLTGLAVAIGGWMTAIATKAQQAVGAMRRLQGAFEKIEARRRDRSLDTLEQHDERVGEAEALLEQAEEAAAEAQRKLFDRSAASRIAAFIRSRAEGDTYSRHLGIVATVRRDFEQLTVLMRETHPSGNQKQEDNQEAREFNRGRAETRTRIRAIARRYFGPATDQPTREAFKPVCMALKRLTRANLRSKPPGLSLDRIVLFIDDLDRCPPGKVYEVLQAVHLFLSFPLFVVIVGVDTRWMEASLETKLGKLVDGSSGATPQDYLEKIFQIPYWTRRMDAEASQGFVHGVLGRLPASSEQLGPDQEAPVPDTEDQKTTVGHRSNPINTDATADGEEIGNDPDDRAAGEDDAEGQDTQDEDNGPSSVAVPTRFGPVVLTDSERAVISELAPVAGRSPRQLLRFVNVYGLIKSVTRNDGSAEFDPSRNDMQCNALLAQLAIATGAPRAAAAYFDALETSRGDAADLRRRISESLSIRKLGDAELRTIDSALGCYAASAGVMLAADGAQLHWSDDEAIDAELWTRLAAELRKTAATARRYTFAAPDAVRLNLPDPPEAAGSPAA